VAPWRSSLANDNCPSCIVLNIGDSRQFVRH
jgi:hypothetical protein